MLCLLQSASTKPKAVMWILLAGWFAPRGEPEVWGEKCSIRRSFLIFVAKKKSWFHRWKTKINALFELCYHLIMQGIKSRGYLCFYIPNIPSVFWVFLAHFISNSTPEQRKHTLELEIDLTLAGTSSSFVCFCFSLSPFTFTQIQ